MVIYRIPLVFELNPAPLTKQKLKKKEKNGEKDRNKCTLNFFLPQNNASLLNDRRTCAISVESDLCDGTQ